MTTLQAVYERQRAAENARWQVREIYEGIYWSLDARARERVNVYDHPDVKAAIAEAERLTLEVAALREQVGGRVFRIVDSKLDDLRKRIDTLNRKAKKLGTEPVVLTVSDEREQDVIKVTRAPADAGEASIEAVEGTRAYDEEVIDFTYVTVNGPVPMIAGWVFVATLDHETEGDDDSVGIRRAPVGIGLINQVGEEAAAAVEACDLTAYRHAPNKCDHCGYERRRNQTYVLYEVESGKLRQIGSTCLRDYTGANNPERIAAWAEWLEALYADLGSGDYVGGEGTGRIAMRTLDYLANVAAVIREDGWTARWRKDYYGGFERNHNATADVAESNYFAHKPNVPVTPEDRDEATAALERVRDDLGERDELDEFQHNLVTYSRGDYVPPKGSGFIAYTIMARQREIERHLEDERKENAPESEWVGEQGERIKGLTFTVTFVREFPSAYGTNTLTKGYTPEGNGIVWWGKGDVEQGRTYTANATVKRHERDKYNGGGKVTQISNVRSLKEVEA